MTPTDDIDIELADDPPQGQCPVGHARWNHWHLDERTGEWWCSECIREDRILDRAGL
jgi:hypothetical protein